MLDESWTPYESIARYYTSQLSENHATLPRAQNDYLYVIMIELINVLCDECWLNIHKLQEGFR